MGRVSGGLDVAVINGLPSVVDVELSLVSDVPLSLDEDNTTVR